MLAANEAVAGASRSTPAFPASIASTKCPTRSASWISKRSPRISAIRSGSAPFRSNDFPSLDSGRGRPQSPQGRQSLPREDFDISSRNYQRLIAKIAGKPEERILSYLMLRSLKQARYSDENEATSRWRRRLHALHFAHPPLSRTWLSIAFWRTIWTRASRFSMKRSCTTSATTLPSPSAAPPKPSANSIEWKKVKFMEDRVGEEFDALIISTTKFGFFVELTELFVEGLVPIETLPGDRFSFTKTRARLWEARAARAYSIGDAVRVRLDRADTVERKLQFAVVDEGARERRRGKRKTKA